MRSHTYRDGNESWIKVEIDSPVSWYVSDVWTDPAFRWEGRAGRLLDLVCAEADRLGVTMTLVIAPSFGGLTRHDLRDFYGRRGFLVSPQHPDSMIRIPTVVTQRVTSKEVAHAIVSRVAQGA
jgi:hypothetical protein